MKVYLSVPIIANRNLDRARFLAKLLESMGHSVQSKWVVSCDPGFTITPNAVFKRDTEGVKDSDILVADISMPSHGVGMEIMLAHLNGKAIICLFERGASISRMIQGIPGISLIEFMAEKEMAEKLSQQLQKIKLNEGNTGVSV